MKTFKRNNSKGQLEFIRWDWKWIGFGVHLGRGNYVKGRGIEIFTNQYRTCPRIFSPFIGWHLGWTKAYSYTRKKFLRVDWSGSNSKPWTSWTLRIWRFGIGTDTPKWIQNKQKRKQRKKWDREFSEIKNALQERERGLDVITVDYKGCITGSWYQGPPQKDTGI